MVFVTTGKISSVVRWIVNRGVDRDAVIIIVILGVGRTATVVARTVGLVDTVATAAVTVMKPAILVVRIAEHAIHQQNTVVTANVIMVRTAIPALATVGHVSTVAMVFVDTWKTAVTA
jgi:hypothetical protein